MYRVELKKQKEVMKNTGGKGVDVVFDPVGKLIPSLKCVNWGARLVVVGFANGPIEKVPANLLLLKSASIVGLYWGATFGKSSKMYRLMSRQRSEEGPTGGQGSAGVVGVWESSSGIIRSHIRWS